MHIINIMKVRLEVLGVQICHGHQKEGLGIECPAWNADSLHTLASSMVDPDMHQDQRHLLHDNNIHVAIYLPIYEN